MHVGPALPRLPPEVRGKKVKSGCRTCKVRKVKCDEDRPACRRCTSTGRACGGYGIWGGGSKPPAPPVKRHPQRPDTAITLTVPAQRIPTCTVTGEEQHCLQYFQSRTRIKLPGLCASAYWDGLVFQASVKEPAIRHAVIAVSAVHRSEHLSGDRLGARNGPPGSEESFMLKHYNKAISLLHANRSEAGRSEARVTLVACVLFVYLELLRGRYQTAQEHLRNGLALVDSPMSTSSAGEARQAIRKDCREVFDPEAVEVLSGLQARAALMFPADGKRSYGSTLPCPRMCATPFGSFHQAKQNQDALLSSACALSTESHQYDVCGITPLPLEVAERQWHLLGKLDEWEEAYELFHAHRKPGHPLYDEVHDHALRSHHAMARIVGDSSARVPNGPASAVYTAGFLTILTHSVGILNVRHSTSFENLHKKLHGTNVPNGPDHVIEMGWIPPLFYTATKCRVPRIRYHAIRLLERSPHREGVWAAPIMVAIARKVMQMEDPESYNRLCNHGDFPLDHVPTEAKCELSCLKEHNIIGDVQIVLPDDPSCDVVIRYSRRNGFSAWEITEMAYDVLRGKWREKA